MAAKRSGGGSEGGFSEQERKAMQARAKEAAAEQRANRKRADGEQELLAAIAAMSGLDQAIAERIHALVTEVAPELWPKTWYGMPAYARDGKVICFFQAAGKFDSRYATFGFTDNARLDAGVMWPTSFALVGLTEAEERRIRELVQQAVG
ncbi:MAG: DUF1801 domain-containing protein [Roseiflexaceae bacterium]